MRKNETVAAFVWRDQNRQQIEVAAEAYRDGGEVCLDDCGVARDKVIELGCGGSQPTLSAALAACGVKLFPKLKSARTQPLVFAYPIIPF